MKVEIRKAKEDEKELFATLSCELAKFNHQHDPRGDLESVLTARKEKAYTFFDKLNEHQLILFAFVDQQPAGFIRAHLYQTDLAVDRIKTWSGSIDELYVDDRYRGLGLGHKLIDESMNWMEQKQVTQVTLETYSWNHHAAGFYERKGFEKTDIIWRKKC